MISFIVAISGTSPRRSKNFYEMLDCLQGQVGIGYEIVIVELVTDGIRYWDWVAGNITAQYKAIYDDTFSLSWCYNVGARIAKGNILVFMGADIMCREGYVEEIQRQFQGNFSCGWNESKYFGELGTRHYYDHHRPMEGWQEEDGAKFAMPNKGSGWGMATIFRKDFFWHIGGFNENYQEWGAEDQEIQRRAIAIDKTNEELDYTLYHLYHTERQKHYEHKDEIYRATAPYPKQISKRLVDAGLGDPLVRKLISLDNLETEDVSRYD